MKILYFIHQFFPNYYTGTERYTLNIAKMMQKFGHEVKVITYNPNLNQKKSKFIELKEYVYDGVSVLSFKDSENEYKTTFDLECKKIENFFYELLDKEKPDLVHVTHPIHTATVINAANYKKIKTVITLTDYWMLCPKGIFLRSGDNSPCTTPDKGCNCKKYCYQTWPLKRLEQRFKDSQNIFKKTDAQIASANFLVNIFKYNDFDMSKLTFIRHGYNYFDKYIPIDTQKRRRFFTVISVGSLYVHKGVHLLIEAVKKIKHNDIRLKIYGVNSESDEYVVYLKKLANNDKRILFEKTYTIDQTPKIHEEADLVVQPSMWYETYPLVGVAALAYGVPIIMPDTTGAAELVNPGENGYIFKFGDIDSLAEQIEKAYKERLKQNKIIFYPQTVESEAVATEAVYNSLFDQK